MKNLKITLFARGWAVALGLVAAAHSGMGAEPSKALLIVPGSNIGKTYLGPNGSDYLKRLPAPTASEGGMSQGRFVWLSGKAPRTHTLFIHTTANGALVVKPLAGATIDEIRITSPEFSTALGIKCGSSLARILAVFPHASLPDANKYSPDAGNWYFDRARGIAFEFDGRAGGGSPCIAITVFLPGSPRFTSWKVVAELLKNHP